MVRTAAARVALWLIFLVGVLLSTAAWAQAPGGPWLGIGIEKGRDGVRIKEVLPGSPCAAADVHPGDEVLAIGGAQVTSPVQLIGVVGKSQVGKPLKLALRSPQGKDREITLTPGPRPDLRVLQRDLLLHKPAPDFHPRVLSGAAVPSLRALRGQVVLLDFFASWCGPCMAALPEVVALHQRYQGRGLRVVGLSAEDEATVKRVAREHALPYSVAIDVDEKAASAYRVGALPTVVLVDRAGVVRSVSVGDLDVVTQEIEAALSATPGKPGP